MTGRQSLLLLCAIVVSLAIMPGCNNHGAQNGTKPPSDGPGDHSATPTSEAFCAELPVVWADLNAPSDLQGLPNEVTNIDIDFREITHSFLSVLACRSSLRAIVFHNAIIDDTGLAIIGTARCLQVLELDRCRGMSAKGLSAIASCAALESLTLRQSDVAPFPSAASDTFEFRHLKFLSLEGSDWVTDAVLGRMSAPKLTHLIINRCGKLRLSEAATFQHIGRVELLFANDLQLGLGVKASLGALRYLKTVSMQRCNYNEKISLDALVSLPIDSVDLSGCYNFADSGLSEIAKGRAKELLLFDAPWLTPEVILQVASMPNLEVLGVGGSSKLTDASLLCLQNASSIRALTLMELPEVTSAVVRKLLNIRPLRSLTVIGCPKVDRQLATLDAPSRVVVRIE